MKTDSGSQRTGYDDFLDILGKFRGLSAIALGTSVSVPFFAYLSGIAPPWPPGMVFVTALVEIVVLVVVFQFLRNSPRRTVNRVIAGTAPALIIFSALYLLLFSFFTYAIPTSSQRSVKGFVCQKGLLKSYEDACPFLTTQQLRDVAYTAEALWQGWSIDLMRFFLSAIWLTAFLFLSILVGSFIVFQTKVKSRRTV